MIEPLRRTLLPFSIFSLLLLLGMAAALFDSSTRQREELIRADEKRALVAVLPSAELFFSSSARWIRHPALTEEMAPFADSPSALDLDPAGALHPPLSLHRLTGHLGQLDPIENAR